LLGSFLALGERKYADFAEIEQAILQKVRQQMNEILQAIAESCSNLDTRMYIEVPTHAHVVVPASSAVPWEP
jgi:hypothetical protein